MNSIYTHIPFPQEKIGPGAIYRSPLPTSEELDFLKSALDIKTIVQLCLDSEFEICDNTETLERYWGKEFQVIKFCIEDYSVPKDIGMAWNLVDQIITETKQGRCVLIHCFAGKGRTGLILSLIAMKVFGFQTDLAVEWVRKYIPEAVETSKQEVFLVEAKQFLPPQEDDSKESNESSEEFFCPPPYSTF